VGTATAVTLLLFTAHANAFDGYKQFSALPETPPTSSGELIYQEMGCVMCHGIQGDGNGFLADGLNPKPRDFTDYKVMSRIPDQSIKAAINYGISKTAMPSFELSDSQIEDLTAYLRSFLAESYLTVNSCIMDTQIVDTKMDTTDFRVEVGNPELIKVKKDGSLLYITPNPRKVMKILSSTLISVRLHKCFR